MDFYHLGDMMDFGQQQQEMTGTSSHSELHPLFHCENKCRNKPFSLSLFFPLPLFVRQVRVHCNGNQFKRLRLGFSLWRTWIDLEKLDFFELGRSCFIWNCRRWGKLQQPKVSVILVNVQWYIISGLGGYIYALRVVGKVTCWILKNRKIWVL